ncbi:MAG: hypothetical protein ACRCZF_25530, partial [Gemmataceae bacterium]
MTRTIPRGWLATLLGLACLVLAGTSPNSSRAADEAKIHEAVKKAAAHLAKHHTPGVSNAAVDTHAVGLSGLIGLALLEAEYNPKEGSLNAIVQLIRTTSYTEDQTYNVALAIIFLDRLNDTVDIPLIQLLGCRLMAGQT